MKYRRLGRTELTVSTVGVGTWQFGGEWGKDFSQAEADAILGRARDLGINLVDTAECYGDHLSEELVGRAIARNRADWVVATKFGHRYHGLHERTQEWSAQEVIAQLERSLRALGTDYIDVYQFHSGGDDVFDQDELWEALGTQVRAGKVRHLGISIGSNANVYQTDRAAEVGASVVQLVYSRLDREPEKEVLASCERQDLGVLAREALAGGLLSGKYAPGTRFTDPADTRSRRPDGRTQERLSEVQRIAEEEVPPGTDMAAWALAWCLRQPSVAAVIPGCKSVAQLDSNAAAAELDLAD
ncbi:aldo/keto reductase [Sinomonas atrocyanea]|uniref:Aldo/keto reductase n=1 Tax=Sinomonas atrocyanea TaxID=37927 RepID=A0A126ZW83_9MICC|nr:aldo/keto reductase [Sinomonas atrocyanea]AMM31353.1 aldo/keto reductase [Sinomonas atrocyanea]GEB64442.1 oxidoreductase [Sinomonas atrocyanea]GGG62853.1 oxidoreductase [Sinomonas atrocyanea]